MMARCQKASLSLLILSALISSVGAVNCPSQIAPTSITTGMLDGTPVHPKTFALIGDYGYGKSPNAQSVARMVRSWNPAFVVTAGDNTYGSLEVGSPDWSTNIGSLYGSFIKRRADNLYPEQTSDTMRFFACIGNHDTWPDHFFGGENTGFLDYLHGNPGGIPRMPAGTGVINSQSCYYDFVIGEAHFFVIDGDQAFTNAASMAAQRAWALQAVTNSTAKWKFILLHPPPFTGQANTGFSGFRWYDVWSRGVNAVFCGHSHRYERLNLTGMHSSLAGSGLRQFTMGISGATLDGLVNSPPPYYEKQYNQNFGAMRITVDEFSAHFEMLTTNDGTSGANGGVLQDSYVMGTPRSSLHPEEKYCFYAEEGQSISLYTETPSTLPLGSNTLDPSLILTTPNGIVMSDLNGAADQRNAALNYVATVDGYYTIVIAAQGLTTGSYKLHLDAADLTQSALPAFGVTRVPFTSWISTYVNNTGSAASNPLDDPDQDGLSNSIEYFLGNNPYVRDQAETMPQLSINQFGSVRYSFNIPISETNDIYCAIEKTTDLSSGIWEVIAEKNGSQAWASAAGIRLTLKNNSINVVVRDPPLIKRSKCFYRMKISLLE